MLPDIIVLLKLFFTGTMHRYIWLVFMVTVILMAQWFSLLRLATSTIGVPKPRKEDLVIDDEDSDEYKYRKFRENKANKCKY